MTAALDNLSRPRRLGLRSFVFVVGGAAGALLAVACAPAVMRLLASASLDLDFRLLRLGMGALGVLLGGLLPQRWARPRSTSIVAGASAVAWIDHTSRGTRVRRQIRYEDIGDYYRSSERTVDEDGQPLSTQRELRLVSAAGEELLRMRGQPGSTSPEAAEQMALLAAIEQRVREVITARVMAGFERDQAARFTVHGEGTLTLRPHRLDLDLSQGTGTYRPHHGPLELRDGRLILRSNELSRAGDGLIELKLSLLANPDAFFELARRCRFAVSATA